MAYRYKKLRIKVPSLRQGNAVKPRNDWCGRTSSSMIYNYYYLVSQNKTLDEGRDELIINMDHELGLVFRDSLDKKKSWFEQDGHEFAAYDDKRRYQLLGTLQEGTYLINEDPNVDWHQGPWGVVLPLDPPDKRGDDIPSEREVQAKLAPIIDALEANNPVLFYSGLSKGPKHIVVISGYELRRGRLWLHIDDPGEKYEKDKKFGVPELLREKLSGVLNGPVVEVCPADHAVDPNNSGFRYWLRAQALFAPNTNTEDVKNDTWGDHGDPSHARDGKNRWGMSMYYTYLATPRSAVVEVIPFASYPTRMPPGGESDPEVLDTLWASTAESGATYPIGNARVWNNGVRIPQYAVNAGEEEPTTEEERAAQEKRSREVNTIFPGQIVAARFGVPGEGGPDRGMVIIRHAWNKKVRDFVEVPEGKLEGDLVAVFSLYARLERPEDPMTSPIVALADPGAEVELVSRVAPGDKVVVAAEKGTSGELQLLETVQTVGAPMPDGGGSFSADELFEGTIDGTPYHVVPMPKVRRNLEHWDDRPQGPAAPNGAALAYHNPHGDLIDTQKTAASPAPRLVADLSGDQPALVEVAAGDGGSWFAVDPYSEPGIDLSLHRYAAYDDITELEGRPGVLVLRVKSLTFTAPEVGGARTITFGGDKKPVVLSCDGPDQPALEAGAKSGAKATPRLTAIVPESALDASTGEVTSGAKLSYWDARTGDVYATSATTKKKLSMRGQRGLPDGFVAIEAEPPVLEVPHTGTFGQSSADVTAMVNLGPDAFPLLCVDDPKFYRTTQQNRTFPNSDHVPLRGRVLFSAKAQHVAGRMRAWPTVTPVAFLTDAQAESARAEVATAFDPARLELAGRVERGESALMGVFLDDKGWELDGEVVRVAEGWTDPVRLHRVIYVGTKKNEWWGHKGFNEDEGNVIDVLPTEGLELRIVSTFEGYNKRRGLVEVRFATAELGTNAVDVAAYKLRKKVCELLPTKLDSDVLCSLDGLEKDARDALGDLAGLADVPEGSALGWRNVAGISIGHMGRTRQYADFGVHVEVFSKEYIIPSTNGSRWPVVTEAKGERYGTQAYFFAQQNQVMVNDKLCAGTQHGKACEQKTRNKTEWADFCIGNRRLLSRIVGFHTSQWAIDWNEVGAVENDPDSMSVVVDAMPAVERAPTDLAALKIDGLDATEYYYYHPLRLVEWLTTGLDVAVSDLSDGTAEQLRAYLDIDGEAMDMVQPAEGEPYFTLRLVVNDAKPGGSKTLRGQEAVLELDGLPTRSKHDRIPVLLKRGRVGQYSFAEPGVAIALSHEEPGFGLPDDLGPVRSEYGADVYLLGDGNEKIEESGVSTITAVATARYNLAPPVVGLSTLSSDAFTVVERKTTGAGASGPRLEHIAPSGEAAVKYPTQSREVNVITKVAPPRSTSAETTLKVKFVGGDLESDEELELRIHTREIRVDDEGEDVAKLQLYLSRIRIDEVPCFVRLKDEKGKAVRERRMITGVYDEGTGEALWRFILYFSQTDDWCMSTRITTNMGEFDTTPSDCKSLEERVAELVESGEFPVLTDDLITELIDHYQIPWVPPSLAFGAPVVDAPGPGELHMLEDWAAWSNASKTTLLPQLDAPGVLLPVKLVEKTSGTEALRVEVVVNAEHGYQVADPVPRTVADLLGGIVLEPSGVLTPKDAKPRIDVYAQDRTLHLLSMELGGVPNLKKSPTDGYALAALQTYLAAKGEYKGDIDGEWGSKSRTALNKLAAAYGCNKDDRYPELVARLMEPEDDE